MATTTTATPSSAHDEPPVARSDWWWRLGALAAPVVTFLVYVYISLSAKAPRTPWDENGVLEMARVIAGDDSVAKMSGSGYYPGWSFVMAPLWWVTDDPQHLYRLAIWLVIAIMMLTIVPLARVASALGLTRSQAVVVASLACLLPARAVNADYVLSESLLMFWVAWTVAAVFSWHKAPTWWRAALVGVFVSLAYLTHTRALALVATAAIWLLMIGVRRWRHAVSGLVVLAIGYVLVKAAVAAVTEPILLDGFNKEEILSTAIKSTTPELIAKIAISQTWSQLVATFGLIALGAVVLTRRVVGELRGWNPGPSTFVAGMLVSTMAVSFLWWSAPQFLLATENPRFDVWVYTRYIDPAATIVVVIALAALVQRVSRRDVLAAAAVCVVVIVPAVLWVAPNVPTYGSGLGPGNNGGVLQWRFLWGTGTPFELPMRPSFTNANRFWLLASIAVLACLGFALLVRRYPRFLIGTTAVVFLLAAVAANPSQKRLAPDDMRSALERIDAVAPGDAPVSVSMDRTCPRPGWQEAQVINWVGFWFSPRKVTIGPAAQGQVGDAPVVIGCDGGPPLQDRSALRVKRSTYNGYALWVVPGKVQDAAQEAGLLLPADFTG